MYRVCSSRSEIQSGKEFFLRLFSSEDHEERDIILTFRPSAIRCKVRQLPGNDYWYYILNDWHAFGRIRDIAPNDTAKILCEINFPEDNINRRFAGVVLKDEVDNYCIGHRGNIGGGVEGRGRSTFWRKYKGKTATVDDDGRETQIALVCALGNPEAPTQLASFLRQVSSIRDAEI